MSVMDFSYLIIDKTRPVVFLDMCGVVADIFPTWGYGISKFINDRQVRVSTKLPGDRVHWPTWEMLRALIDKYDAQVIVVSSWLKPYLRKDHPDVVWFSGFLETNRVEGSLNTGGGSRRGEIVKEFVVERGLTKWLVVDDSIDRMYLDRTFFNARRYIHPFGRYGLGGKELEKMDYLLGRQFEDDEYLERLFEIEGLEKW